MDWLNYTLNLLNPTTVVNNVVVGLILAIVGLISGIISGIIVFKYKWKKAEKLKQKEKLEQERNKEIERENEKKKIIASLLLEIEENQVLLQPIYKMVKPREDDIESVKDDKLPKTLNFIENSYSKELSKLDFLEGGLRAKLVQYYSEIKYIEEEYKRLDTIHGQPHSYITYLNLREFGQTKKYEQSWYEIERFLVNTKNVYDLGEDLINVLKK